jgi:hypothetical protein
MGLIVNTTDFVGRYELALNPLLTPKLDDYINQMERSFIYKILGIQLGASFVNDLTNGVPSDSNYLLIFNELFFESSCKAQFHSIGLKSVLLGLIYSSVIIESRLTSSALNGVAENSVQGQVVTSRTEAFNRYNDSVDSIKAIQRFCSENSDDFLEYNGQKFLYQW